MFSNSCCYILGVALRNAALLPNSLCSRMCVCSFLFQDRHGRQAGAPDAQGVVTDDEQPRAAHLVRVAGAAEVQGRNEKKGDSRGGNYVRVLSNIFFKKMVDNFRSFCRNYSIIFLPFQLIQVPFGTVLSL